MQPTLTATPATDHTLAQGVAAAQAGNHTTAFGLLAEVLSADESCTTAWLWLSGVTSDPAERRYCLERVLASDPAHAAARRGLSMLPPAASCNPLLRHQPPAPSPSPAQASPAMATTIQLDEPPKANRPSFDQVAPAMGSTIPLSPAAMPMQQPAPPAFAASSAVAAPPPASAPELPTAPYSQEQIDFALRQLANGLDEDQAARNVCERLSMTWDHAQELVQYVKTHKAVALARSQGPMYMVVGVITLIGGILLTFNYGAALLDLALSPYALSPRVFIRWVVLALTGMSMTIGGGFGIMTTLRSWWR
jgi:hypothetical protein